MAVPSNIDAHAKPPAAIKDVYKKFQKLDAAKLDKHPDLLDLSSNNGFDDGLAQVSHIEELPCDLRQVFIDFLAPSEDQTTSQEAKGDPHAYQQRSTVYEVEALPGKLLHPVAAHHTLKQVSRLIHLSFPFATRSPACPS